MEKIKKFIVIFLTVVMILSMVGCGSKAGNDSQTNVQEDTGNLDDADSSSDETSDESDGDEDSGDLADIIPEETVTLDVYSQLANYSGEQIGWFAQVMKEKFNVVLNIINEGDGTFATRMASGNLGDIVVFGNDSDEYLQAINAGLLYDWEEDDLVQTYGSYIWEHMQNALEKNRNISPDGKLYGFGHNVGTSPEEHEAFFYHPDIRWDLYKELGYPEVKTLEDFIDVLEDMVRICPTSDTGGRTYGVSLFPDWDGNMVMFVKATGALYGYDEFGFGLYNVNTQTYEDCLKEDGMYLRCLKFYNQLYQRGLLDPDSMTQTYEDMAEAYQTGAAFFTIFDWMGSGLYNTQEHLSQGKAMLPLAAEDQKNLCYGLNINGGNRVWTIGAKTDYPELCMAIINWLATPEGTMTNFYGPKGVTWDYDEEGNPYLTELGEACMSNGETEMTDGYSGTFSDGTNQINNTTWSMDATNPEAADGQTFNYNFWKTRISRPVSEIEQDWRDFTGALEPNEYLEKNGHISIAIGTSYSEAPKSDELMTIWNQVAETIKTYSWRAIYAESDEEYESIVNEMTQKCYEYGYEQCVEFQKKEAEIRASLENEVKASIGN